MIDTNIIPAMTDPLGRHWDQPPRECILLDDTHAIMSSQAFKALHDYSRSMPSGVYPGKMWKAIMPDGQAFLRWFGIVVGNPDVCSNNQREILIVDNSDRAALSSNGNPKSVAQGNE